MFTFENIKKQPKNIYVSNKPHILFTSEFENAGKIVKKLSFSIPLFFPLERNFLRGIFFNACKFFSNVHAQKKLHAICYIRVQNIKECKTGLIGNATYSRVIGGLENFQNINNRGGGGGGGINGGVEICISISLTN